MSAVKTKFKISQLAAKPATIELIHPSVGETGIVLEIVGQHSKTFQEALAIYESSDNTPDDNIRLLSSCIVGWDSDSMEMDWSVENAFKFFSDPANQWAIAFLTPFIKNELNFYIKK
jgi:hypothetical protein